MGNQGNLVFGLRDGFRALNYNVLGLAGCHDCTRALNDVEHFPANLLGSFSVDAGLFCGSIADFRVHVGQRKARICARNDWASFIRLIADQDGRESTLRIRRVGIRLAKHIERWLPRLKLNAINGVFPIGVLAQLNTLGAECFSSTGVQCRAFCAAAPSPQIIEFVLPSCCLVWLQAADYRIRIAKLLPEATPDPNGSVDCCGCR